MAYPNLLPRLLPRITDLQVVTGYGGNDQPKPIDEEAELLHMEAEHQKWIVSIANKNNNIVPIGKTASEQRIEEEEEEEEGDEEEDSNVSQSPEEEEDEFEIMDHHDIITSQSNSPEVDDLSFPDLI